MVDLHKLSELIANYEKEKDVEVSIFEMWIDKIGVAYAEGYFTIRWKRGIGESPNINVALHLAQENNEKIISSEKM